MSQDLLEVMGPDLVQQSKYGTETAHKSIAGSSFLPRLQLCGSNSNLCKRGKVPIGSYAIVRGKDTVLHLLGDSVNLLVISWRPKALRFGNGSMQVHYNPASPQFKQIEIDSTKEDSGCMYGPEYLVYVPSVNEFCTFHFNNPTMRQSAAGMIPNVGKAVTCNVEFIDKGKYSWHGPTILNCSTPLTPTTDLAKFKEDLLLQRDKFNNPKESEELEEAPAESASTEGRAR